MTRTVAFGDPGDQMKEIYAVVQQAQQAGVDAVHAGVHGKDVDAVVDVKADFSFTVNVGSE